MLHSLSELKRRWGAQPLEVAISWDFRKSTVLLGFAFVATDFLRQKALAAFFA
jgi:hypothetical protein